ncbi:MAG: BrnA antitoxin family protein [Sedimentitalea sp.]|uniref:BrnA antitoxin family protein n=1 Tax=Sedimentitalea sp. TaxID=2048915 RepID=UPI003263E8A1
MVQYQKPLSADELKALDDKDIDFSDQPELDESFWANARVVMPEDRNLTQVTAKFDKEVVDWFRQQGRGYQARMNSVLRSYYEAHKGT